MSVQTLIDGLRLLAKPSADFNRPYPHNHLAEAADELERRVAYAEQLKSALANVATRTDGDGRMCWCDGPPDFAYIAQHTGACLSARAALNPTPSGPAHGSVTTTGINNEASPAAGSEASGPVGLGPLNIVHYTCHEGGKWLEWGKGLAQAIPAPKDMPCPNVSPTLAQFGGLYFHSVRFPDGRIWDAVNGWRPIPFPEQYQLVNEPDHGHYVYALGYLTGRSGGDDSSKYLAEPIHRAKWVAGWTHGRADGNTHTLRSDENPASNEVAVTIRQLNEGVIGFAVPIGNVLPARGLNATE